MTDSSFLFVIYEGNATYIFDWKSCKPRKNRSSPQYPAFGAEYIFQCRWQWLTIMISLHSGKKHCWGKSLNAYCEWTVPLKCFKLIHIPPCTLRQIQIQWCFFQWILGVFITEIKIFLYFFSQEYWEIFFFLYTLHLK